MLSDDGIFGFEEVRMDHEADFTEEELKYLRLLSRSFPSIQSASSEIINLQAIMDLPKGTEHFLSDLHGEYEAFAHMLRNASGVVKTKVDEVFGTTLGETERKTLATLIYYPQQKLELLKAEQKDLHDWYRITLYRLIEVCRQVSSKYTRSKVRKALPKDFSYVIDELIHGFQHMPDQNAYYDKMIETIIDIQRADAFIVALCELITRLAIDKLHIIGDIFDRGPGAHVILDELMNYHDVDIQWGNHDIQWMGAAAGNAACIAGVLRLCCRYNNLDTVEEGYGISLRPLAMFAQEMYKDDPCEVFKPESTGNGIIGNDQESIGKIHKAITIIQLKLEGQLLQRHPEYDMAQRDMLSKINYEKGTVCIDGQDYPMVDTHFPTIDPANPLKLHPEEEETVRQLVRAFRNNTKLQEHIRFLFARGSMYKTINSNLLYHGCIPLHPDGVFAGICVSGIYLTGKALLDGLEQAVRQGYFSPPGTKGYGDGLDLFWYLWCG
ncbi:MAG: fructose-bisphosphatase class III, partial [Firmicutes bacterium]|nr:fructose-bisphosphatase class III [Bacillota bacterium]